MPIQLVQGDCREVLATMPAASFDCIITDPPYGDTSLAWDKRVDGWLDACARVLKPNGSLWCFGSMRFFFERYGDFSGWKLAQDIVWEKHNGSGSAADRFRRVHEHAIQFYRGEWASVYKSPQFTSDATARTVRRKQRPPHWGVIADSSYRSEDGGPRLMRSVIPIRSEHGRAIHPTQKPVELLKPIIAYSCPEAGSILDPFAGSGSTGIAARAIGRNATLIEIDPEYAASASHRLRDDAPLLAAE